MLQKGIGCIGVKSLGGEALIVAMAVVPIEQALDYVFSLPISTLVSGIDSEKVLDQNLKVVRNDSPMSQQERHALEHKYMQVAGDGRFELFKSSKMFDGPVHQRQRGFDPTVIASCGRTLRAHSSPPSTTRSSRPRTTPTRSGRSCRRNSASSD